MAVALSKTTDGLGQWEMLQPQVVCVGGYQEGV